MHLRVGFIYKGSLKYVCIYKKEKEIRIES